jgi:transcription elongation factor Elf1
MAKLSDELTHTFECPHCGHEITESLARLKDDPVITCGRCGKSTKFESAGTIRETTDNLDEIDRAWDKLTKD